MKRRYLTLLSFSTAMLSLSRLVFLQESRMVLFAAKISLVLWKLNQLTQPMPGSSSSGTQAAFLDQWSYALLQDAMIREYEYHNHQLCWPPWQDYMNTHPVFM